MPPVGRTMIVAVVLTFAPREGMLEACVDSVVAAGGVDHVLVVDNGHSAAERLVGRLGDDVELIVSETNLGYAGGMNVGIHRALALGADAVLLLNDDLVVERGAVGPLVAALAADGGLGAVQPKLVLPGPPPRRVGSMGVVLGRDGAGVDVAMGELDGPELAEDRDIEAFTGGAVLVRAAFLREVGAFDERLFMYYEDVDLALRGREAGWRYRCIVSSVVVHEGGATAGREEVRLRTVYLRERNRLWVLLRHRPPRDVAIGVWLSIRRLRWTPRGTHARALLAGVAAAPRLLVARRRARSAGAGAAVVTAR